MLSGRFSLFRAAATAAVFSERGPGEDWGDTAGVLGAGDCSQSVVASPIGCASSSCITHECMPVTLKMSYCHTHRDDQDNSHALVIANC